MLALVKNSIVMVMGTLGAQLIAFISLPLLTYFYPPDKIGLFTTALSYISIIGLCSSLRLERNFFTIWKNLDKYTEINIVRVVSLIFSFVLIILMCILIKLDILLFPIAYTPYVFSCGLLVSFIQIESALLSSLNQFKKIAVGTMLRSVFLILLQLSLLCFLDYDNSLLLGSVLSTLICFFYIKKINFILQLKSVGAFFLDKKNRSESFYGGVHALLGGLSVNIPMIMTSSLWNFYIAGLFAISEKLVRVPINLIVNNVRPVIQNEIKNKPNINVFSYLFRLSIWFLLSSLLFSFSVFFIAEWFFNFILPKDWVNAVVYFKILIFLVVPSFSFLPFQAYNMLFVKMKALSFMEVLFFFLRFFLIYLVYYFDADFIYLCYSLLVVAFLVSFSHLLFFLCVNRSTNFEDIL